MRAGTLHPRGVSTSGGSSAEGILGPSAGPWWKYVHHRSSKVNPSGMCHCHLSPPPPLDELMSLGVFPGERGKETALTSLLSYLDPQFLSFMYLKSALLPRKGNTAALPTPTSDCLMTPQTWQAPDQTSQLHPQTCSSSCVPISENGTVIHPGAQAQNLGVIPLPTLPHLHPNLPSSPDFISWMSQSCSCPLHYCDSPELPWFLQPPSHASFRLASSKHQPAHVIFLF